MAISLSHPLPGARPTDGYGWRDAIPSIGLPAQLHNGQDYAAAQGTPIRAAHAGKVIWVGWDTVGGGWGVQLQSDDNYWSTLYFHMRERSPLAVGQRVSVGQTVGYVGSTGLATGAHLHFMLRSYGSDINPVPYIKTSGGGSTPAKDIEVIAYHREDKFARQRGRTIKPGAGLYLHTSVDNPSQATNVVGAVGQYSITPHVYAVGEPGDQIDVKLIWQTNPGKKNAKNSTHYTERLVIGKDGYLFASREFKRYVGGKAPVAVYVRVEAVKGNKKDVKLTLLDCDAFCFKG